MGFAYQLIITRKRLRELLNVEQLIEKGIFDVYRALEKKMEEVLRVPSITDDMVMEPAAKRSKLGGTAKTK